MKPFDSIFIALVAASLILQNAPAASPDNPPFSPKEYRDFAMSHEGNVASGKQLFSQERTACSKCHSDGNSSKAGPDLFAAGDKFPRAELIRALLEPSASIAVGYGMTIVETKSGEEYQ